MKKLMGWVELKILNHILQNLPTKEVADFIEAWGVKEFGEAEKNEYLDIMRWKMADLVVELGKRKKGGAK